MIGRKAISKIGNDHLYAGTNRQDIALMNEDFLFKLVCDGCGSMPFAEVGAALFAQEILRIANLNRFNFLKSVNQIFAHLTHDLCRDDSLMILRNLSFTILAVFADENGWTVFTCGDGYLLLQQGDELTYQNLDLDHCEYPAYFAYNWVDGRMLDAYQSGVSFATYQFSRDDFANVGVATDGPRFAEHIPDLVDRARFREKLVAGKTGQVEMLINKYQQVFKDDISIAF